MSTVEKLSAVPTPTAPAYTAIYRAMPAIMRDVEPIAKNRDNKSQGYKFRGIDDVYETVQMVLAKHGVFVVPYVVAQERSERETKSGGAMFHVVLTIDHTFYAEDGSHVVARTVGEAMDTGDKASNKGMSAAMKYALIEALCIPTKDPKDTEDHSPEVKPKAKDTEDHSPEVKPKAEPQRQRPWMKRLQAAVAGLKLGEAGATEKGMSGKAREEYIRGYRLMYLCWAAGREDIKSTLDLTDAEADVVIQKAEAGEMPS